MATYYSGYSNEYRLRLDITQGTQNITNNTSVVSWTLYLQSGNKSMSVYSTYHATVNGVASPNTTQTNVNIGFNSSVTLGSGSTTVTHNADGTKSVPFSASFKTNSPAYYGGVLITPGTMTISGNFTLTTIPRYAAITSFGVQINDRNAFLSWTADKTISEWRYSSNSGSSYNPWQTVNAKSGSYSTSVSPGSTYGWRIQVKNSESGLITTSSVVSKTATKTLSTLTLSTTSQNVGSSVTWTINESYDYTHQVQYSFGSAAGYILGSPGVRSNTSSGTWTVPTSLANQMPNATSMSGTVYVHTFYGDTLLGTKYYIFTAKVPNNTTWQPTVPVVTISHVGDRPTGMPSYVQGKSRANVVSSSTAQGGASISSYRVTVSGIGTYYGSNITSGYLTNSGTVTITVRATDSRGYYREKVNTITVVAYSPPKLTAYTASRSPNEEGTDLYTSINFSLSPLDNYSGRNYRIRYRPTDGSWVTLVNNTDYYTRNTTHSATDILDVNKSYEVEFRIADHYTEVIQTKHIGTAFQLMDFNASGRGLAFGKVSEDPNTMEISMILNVMRPDWDFFRLQRTDLFPAEFRMNLSNGNFNVGTPTNIHLFTITPQGRVVIGTYNTEVEPNHKLTVKGTTRLEDALRVAASPTVDVFIGKSSNTTDGTAVLGSIEGTTWQSGLAIGGSSKNLLYKGDLVWHAGNLSGSSREVKKDIEETNHQENFDIFKRLKVYDYNLKDEFDEKKTRGKDHIGLITDEVPDFLTDKDQSYIKLYDLLSLTVSTLQTAIEKVETLESKVKELEKEIEKLKGSNQ